MALTAQGDEVPAAQSPGIIIVDWNNMMHAQISCSDLVLDEEAVPADIEIPRPNFCSFTLPGLGAAEPFRFAVAIALAFISR